jgi:MFS family permease
MSKDERKIVVITALSHGLTHMYIMLFIATNILMAKEFNLSLLRIGMVGTAAYFLFGIGSLPAGFLADRIGGRRVLFLALAGQASAAVIVGMAQGIGSLLFGMVLLGTFAGFYHPSGLAIISHSVQRRERALGYHGMGGNLGMALAPLIAGIIGAKLGWRFVYILFVIPGAIAAFIVFRVLLRGESGRLEVYPQQKGEKITAFLHYLIPVYAIQILGGVINHGSFVFLPKYLSDRLGSTLSSGSLVLGNLVTSGALLIGMLGQYISGHLSSWFKPERFLPITLLISTPFLFAAGFSRGWFLIMALALFSLTHFALQPPANTLVAEYSPPSARSRCYGLGLVLGFGVGSTSATLAGYISDNFGMNWIYPVMGMFSFFAFLAGYIVYRLAKKRGKL